MSTATRAVDGSQRFTRATPCPICGGSDDDRRGQGSRCYGFLSGDGRYCHCTREDHAGNAPFNATAGTYAHRLDGPCKCGTEHGTATTTTPRPKSKAKRTPTYGGPDRAIEGYIRWRSKAAGRDYRVTGRFVYREADGSPLLHVFRLEWGESDPDTGKVLKTFVPVAKVQHPDRPDRHAWVIGDKHLKTLPPYNLPELSGADAVVWVEGERAADALTSIGVVSTTTAHGAKSIDRTDLSALAGLSVVLWPDRDDDGERYVERARSLLARLEPAPTIRIIRPPGLPKSDAFDWVQAGGTRDALMGMIAAAPPIDPPATTTTTGGFDPTPGVIEDVDDPHRLARVYLQQHAHPDAPTLAYFRERCWEWDGQSYRMIPDDEMEVRADVSIKREYDRCNLEEQERGAGDKGPPKARKVTAGIVGNTLRAVRGMTLIPSTTSPPCWRGNGDGLPDPRHILPVRDALLDLSSVRPRADGTIVLSDVVTYEPTPAFFSPFNVGYRFNPAAPVPSLWLRFLRDLWPDDDASRRELQKWFGYLLAPDTRHQKMLYLIGPQRSGKGTIGRVLTRLVGRHNVTNPALMDLAGAHGLQDCVDKSVMLISDARIAGTEGEVARIQERLLKISGEDEVEINPKYKAPFKTLLPTRIVVFSNEVPGFRDPSGAFRSRARPLKLTETFEGREDHTLSDNLTTPEAMAGILNWAIVGRGMLEADGGFLVPDSAVDLVRTLGLTSNPMGLFLEEWADVDDPNALEPTERLYAAYLQFCAETGNPPRSVQIFGRNLRSTEPRIVDGPRADVPETGRRHRHLKGIKLTRQPGAMFKAKAGFAREGAY